MKKYVYLGLLCGFVITLLILLFSGKKEKPVEVSESLPIDSLYVEPLPEIDIEIEPEPEPEPEPELEPVVRTQPIIKIEPETVPEEEIVATPEPVSEPEPEKEIAVAPVPIPEPEVTEKPVKEIVKREPPPAPPSVTPKPTRPTIEFSPEVFEDSLLMARVASLNVEQAKIQLATLESDLNEYNDTYIPQSYFMSLVIQKQVYDNDVQVQYYHNRLRFEYPHSRYTEAANEFLKGEKVTHQTKEEKHQLSRYHYAMELYSQGDSLDYVVSILDSLTYSYMTDLAEKSLYTLGFIYYFDLADTLNSKVYFDILLTSSPTSEYAVNTRKFYDGDNFLLTHRLPSIVEEENRIAEALLREQEEAEAALREQDGTEEPPETEETQETEPEQAILPKEEEIDDEP
jgi:hypothetical protein